MSANPVAGTISPYQDKTDPWSSHSIIREMLADLPRGARILDVGTSTGTLGRLCADAGFRLYGIEPNGNWAQIAAPYYEQVVATSIEEAGEEFLAGYDAVILADVIEHMYHPEEVLARLATRQKPGTRYLFSVPNVANLAIRASLLLGRFDYMDRGILDRTHVRFYTQASLRRFLAEQGFTILRMRTTPIPLNLIHPWFGRSVVGRGMHRGLYEITKMRPSLFGYQFVVEAVRLSHQ